MLFPPQSSRILLLLGGNGLGQLITIAAILFLSRLYDPADFGLLAGIVSVVSLSSVIVHGRYHMAIPVSRIINTLPQNRNIMPTIPTGIGTHR